MKPDVFINYRRDPGHSVAQLLRLGLGHSGFNVFLDVTGLGAGRFDKTLLGRIEDAQDIVVVMTPGCFDRCNNSEDTFRQEIAHALKLKKNVVPVHMPGLVLPAAQDLPEDIRDVLRHQSVIYSPDFVDATIGKLLGYLHTPRRTARSVLVRAARKPLTAILLVVVSTAILMTGWVGLSRVRSRATPSIPFTIGYLHARAVWTAIVALRRSQSDSSYRIELLAGLKQGNRQWPAQQSLDRIATLTRRAGWHWDGYVKELDSLVGASGMLGGLALLQSQGAFPGERVRRLMEITARLEDQSRQLMVQAGETKVRRTDLEMLFAGHQTGKIDQLTLKGARVGTLDRDLADCRTFLRATFEGITSPENRRRIEPILAKYPGVESKVETIDEQGLREVVVEFKRRFLYGMHS